MPNNSGTTIAVVKAAPGLISKYHMRPVLMFPVPVPACPYTVSAAMITSQSGVSGWMSWATPSCNQTSLDHIGRNRMSNSPDQLYPDSRWYEKPISPHDSVDCMVFPWGCHPQLMPMWKLLYSSSSLANMTEDFGDATCWHSCIPRYRPLRQPMIRQPNNEFKNSRWDIGWHGCHFVL